MLFFVVALIRKMFLNKSKIIYNKLCEWSLTCTFHGLPKVFTYKNALIRLALFLIFIVFACLTVWLVARCLIEYFEFDVVTTIRAVNEKNVTFPVLTICDANLFTSKKAAELLAEPSYPSYISADFTRTEIVLNQITNIVSFGFNKVLTLEEKKKKS